MTNTFGLAPIKIEGTMFSYDRKHQPLDDIVMVQEYLRLKKDRGQSFADAWLKEQTA